jgi:hypothetical protein
MTIINEPNNNNNNSNNNSNDNNNDANDINKTNSTVRKKSLNPRVIKSIKVIKAVPIKVGETEHKIIIVTKIIKVLKGRKD